MKNINFMLIFALILLQTSVFAQTEPVDSTGLPGDNFSLEGALEMFKISSSPEDFEKRLNEEDNNVNNLDLNEDGEIDYIRVEDKMEGNVHVLILQVPVNENEVQDIAVIEIEKTGEETAILQIVGDEDLYGPEVYAEPFEEEAEMDGKGGPSAELSVYRIVVNVWVWPSVRYIYAPNYVVWVSPYGWRVYPTWWRPWRPHPWRWHYDRCTRYHAHYRVIHTHRVVNAHRVYAPHRKSSVTVRQRTTTMGVKKTKNGAVVTKKTTTRGAVKNADGNVKAGKKTTTTKTAVKKGDGTVKAGKRTTTETKVQGQNKQGTRKTTTTTKAAKKGNTAGAKKTKTTTTTKRKKN